MSAAQTLQVPGYQVVQYIGSGARSSIWQIKDRQTGEFLSLKRVIRRHNSDIRFLQQAENEYEVGVCLEHPSLRKVLRIRRIKRWLTLKEIHLFMEYCPGTSIQEVRPPDVRDVLGIFHKVAEAMAYMNSKGFVHADMKPNNIIVNTDGTVKVIDLGQSCPIGTLKQRIQGTPDFIAPEQVHRLPIDSRTDVYNFGATLYWTLTGHAIPTVMPKQKATHLKSDMNVIPPENFNSQVTPSLSKLVTDCVEMNPGRRPESMAAVAARLNLISHTASRQLDKVQNKQ